MHIPGACPGRSIAASIAGGDELPHYARHGDGCDAIAAPSYTRTPIAPRCGPSVAWDTCALAGHHGDFGCSGAQLWLGGSGGGEDEELPPVSSLVVAVAVAA